MLKNALQSNILFERVDYVFNPLFLFRQCDTLHQLTNWIITSKFNKWNRL